ncbi:MAG: ACP phosphodiesterase [Bacteroidales bacterium]
MNYLAHIYLSDLVSSDNEFLVGNFIADCVKGRQINNYSDNIKEGIIMHRAIDQYTDNSDEVKNCKLKLRPNFKKFSAVVVDLYFDHFLSKNWSMYSDADISEFVNEKLLIISEYIDIIPKKSALMLNYLIRYKRLVTYSKFEGLDASLTDMAIRIKYRSNMENATEFLKANYNYFETEFFRFFPELISFVNNYKSTLNLETT